MLFLRSLCRLPLLLSLLIALPLAPAHAAKADSYAEDHMLCGVFAIGKVGNEFRMLEMSTDTMLPFPKDAAMAKVVGKHLKGQKADGQIFMLIKYLKSSNGNIQIDSYDIIDTNRFMIVGGTINYTRFDQKMTLDGYAVSLTEEAKENLSKECYTNAPIRKPGHAVISKTNPPMAIMAKLME